VGVPGVTANVPRSNQLSSLSEGPQTAGPPEYLRDVKWEKKKRKKISTKIEKKKKGISRRKEGGGGNESGRTRMTANMMRKYLKPAPSAVHQTEEVRTDQNKN